MAKDRFVEREGGQGHEMRAPAACMPRPPAATIPESTSNVSVALQAVCLPDLPVSNEKIRDWLKDDRWELS